jgi:hypothetical protein
MFVMVVMSVIVPVMMMMPVVMMVVINAGRTRVAGVDVRFAGVGRWDGRLVHAELRRRHAGPQHPVCRDRAVVDGQAAERPSEHVERQAEIQQRPEDHVAGGARETVEVQRLAQRVPFSR